MVVLNAASYVQKPVVPDTEGNPNRSSYNAGATGTKAFYQILQETGHSVARWQENLSNLGEFGSSKSPSVFVMIGPFRRPMKEQEAVELLEWVATGGRLVLIDRDPPVSLLISSSSWKISSEKRNELMEIGVDPADVLQMTREMPAVRPALVTYANLGVYAVQPSRFASRLSVDRLAHLDLPQLEKSSDVSGVEDELEDNVEGEPSFNQEPMSATDQNGDTTNIPSIPAWLKGPLVHLANDDGAIAVEMPYGNGRILHISDPFIVANGGISSADNVQFAINAVGSPELIAFDEYHHGVGSGQNKVVEYFAGTPVVAIFLQIGVIIALVFYSQSRRFARPVPEPEPDRLSKLEYVSAMAELQRRTRAYDLALENIYTDFRRRAAKLFGIDLPIKELDEFAGLIADRSETSVETVLGLLNECEEALIDPETDGKKALRLVKGLRTLERDLGLKRTRSA